MLLFQRKYFGKPNSDSCIVPNEKETRWHTTDRKKLEVIPIVDVSGYFHGL